MATKVVIRHQGKKYDVEVDPNSTGEEFKYQVFSLTGVEPERQKILLKGSQLKDDADMSKLGLKSGQIIMLLGTPSGAGVDIVRPTQAIRFVEDMTDAEAARQEGVTPGGLTNLGNTCYLNSTLQTLRYIPELQTALEDYKFLHDDPAANPMAQLDITNQLKELYNYMGDTLEAFPPHAFLNSLRVTFPQFAERSRTGNGFAQQDAEEAWSQIISQVRRKLTVKDGEDDSKKVPFVDRYMAGEFESTLECDEKEARDAGEEAQNSKDAFLKLNCHISATTNHLTDGIAAGLSEKIEKKSPTLDRDVTYTKTSRISRLPLYLTVHFVRFFWKRESQKKAKIMRKVTFPRELDVVEFCTPELKKLLIPVRDKVREVRKDEEDIERSRKRRKLNPLLDGEPKEPVETKKKQKEAEQKKPAAGTSADGDTEMAATYKTDAEVEAEQQAALLKAKKELRALISPELPEGTNRTGLYELRGVLTHQGASADSGHYTAYVKKPAGKDPKTGEKVAEDGKWWWFNDDKVSEVESDKIDTLSGGGESHSALILLYRAIPEPLEGVAEEA